jgi:hypothetical protein
MGGGLGHLTRARAILNTLELEDDSAILTSSQFSYDKRVIGDVRVHHVPQRFEKDLKGFRLWLRETFDELKPQQLFIDTFPAGILGEFCDFKFDEALRINYIGRLLKWKAYERLIQSELPFFKTTFVLEELEHNHFEFVQRQTQEIVNLDLKYPMQVLTSGESERIKAVIVSHSPFWLIVHSGRDDEVKELIAYAEELREIENEKVSLVLIAPGSPLSLPANVFHYDIYPASILFANASRVISACGFNIMRQMMDHRDKHFFIPFERRYDNQHTRAAHARKGNEEI